MKFGASGRKNLYALNYFAMKNLSARWQFCSILTKVNAETLAADSYGGGRCLSICLWKQLNTRNLESESSNIR